MVAHVGLQLGTDGLKWEKVHIPGGHIGHLHYFLGKDGPSGEEGSKHTGYLTLSEFGDFTRSRSTMLQTNLLGTVFLPSVLSFRLQKAVDDKAFHTKPTNSLA